MEESLRKTGEVPPALANQPEILAEDRLLWQAFMHLSSSRSVSMGGALPIPISEILAYCILYEIDDLEERNEYVAIIQALDQAYLELLSSKSGAKNG